MIHQKNTLYSDCKLLQREEERHIFTPPIFHHITAPGIYIIRISVQFQIHHIYSSPYLYLHFFGESSFRWGYLDVPGS